MSLPTRALYICDHNCGPTCEGCFRTKEDINWTKSIIHAKNGPVVNVREWETRFELEEIEGLLYYVERDLENSK